MRSAVGTGSIGRVTAGDGTNERAPPGVSADTDPSGRGVIDTARNTRAKPAGTAIQPTHPAAGMMRQRYPWSRDLGRGGAGSGGASPCHSHKPASLISVLTNGAEGDIGGVPVTIGALLYVSPISSRDSACMAPTFLSRLQPIPAYSVRHPRTRPGPHRFGSRPKSSPGKRP